MKLITQKDIDTQRDLVERYAHQMLQPRHTLIVDGHEVTVCWIARLNRAQNIVQKKDANAQKAMSGLVKKWETLCKKADDEYNKYIAMCQDANVPYQDKFIPPDCDCIGCRTARRVHNG